MGRFDRLFNAETNPNTSLLANSQTSKEVNPQTSKPVNQQVSKEASQQTSKEVNQHTDKLVNQQTSELVNSQATKQAIPQNHTAHLSTKEKKKYGTYLREDSILNIRVRAAQAGKKDHEFLQELVDYYFENSKN